MLRFTGIVVAVFISLELITCQPAEPEGDLDPSCINDDNVREHCALDEIATDVSILLLSM